MKEDEPRDLEPLSEEDVRGMRRVLERVIFTSPWEWRVLQTLEAFQGRVAHLEKQADYWFSVAMENVGVRIGAGVNRDG